MYKMKVWCFGVVLSIWLLCSLVLVRAAVTDPHEVAALRDIKSKLIDDRKFLDDWTKGDPCLRNWTGVTCFDSARDDGYLHVQELHLLNQNLSGFLAPELGQLTYLQILDFMWNNISGNIPKEIGNLKYLQLLLLNGNKLSGFLPEELGYLSNLDRLQVDENQIQGPLPRSFANLTKVKHLHLNNNSISGQIPPDLSQLPMLMHLLIDNNNLSGYLPPAFSETPSLRILQLDNNNFSGSNIPVSYGNMPRLLKLSLRNCGLQGPIPDLSAIPELGYLDLSWNRLNGSIPSYSLSLNITTILLSNNNLSGVIPRSLSGLPLLQKLSLDNNFLSGSFPSTLWVNVTLGGNRTLILNFENNLLSNVTGPVDPPANVTVMLQGNPMCRSANKLNIIQFCGFQNATNRPLPESQSVCPLQACPTEENYEYVPEAPGSCFCAVPIRVGYRLKSPGFSDFRPYVDLFEDHLTRDLNLFLYQLHIDSFAWEKGPRLRMYLKIYPQVYNDSMKSSSLFNDSELIRIGGIMKTWRVPESPIFGPYELLNFTLLSPYVNVFGEPTTGKGISKSALAGILVGSTVVAIAISSLITMIIMRKQRRKRRLLSKARLASRAQIKIDGVKGFTYDEMARATGNFCTAAQVGQGGYGKVYRGTLKDGTIAAIKRAQEGSLQGEKEFLTEIELLSRLHHRNLVALLGYCDEEGEQMLVYEFLSNGTLRDHLSAKSKKPLSFALRIRMALGAAKGILYLHTEADPPIFHRDIKASNILLDSKFMAKVADFGLSRLAPGSDEEGSQLAISTVVKGTPGYLDPQYFLTHMLTDKSDVYSLGVVFLELLTGMHPIYHGKNLVREVNNAYQSGTIFSIVDSSMGTFPSECVEHFVKLALQCCQEETSGRPSMAEVVMKLEQIWKITPKFDFSQSNSLTNDSEMSSGLRSVSMVSSADQSISSNVVGSSQLVSDASPLIRPR